MEIDYIKNVTDLSAKACQTKDVLTEVDHPLSSAKTLESGVSDSPMRKECRIKTFDSLGPDPFPIFVGLAVGFLSGCFSQQSFAT